MSIDLTGPDEQDWLGGEEAPPIRYSDLTTDTERSASAIEQLVDPVAAVLKDRLPERGYAPPNPSDAKLAIAARTVMYQLNQSAILDKSPSVADLLDRTDPVSEDGEFEMEQYLSRVAEAVVDEFPDSLLQSAAKRAGLTDTSHLFESQTKDQTPSMSRNSADNRPLK
jgi:hypothetical protein